jgi:flagellar hook-length control protein FliK
MQGRKIMSSNAFMLPAPPPIPTCGLDGIAARGPAAVKPGPSGESSDPAKSFSATLNGISERRYGARPKASTAEKAGVTPRDAKTDSASSQTLSKTADRPYDQIEEVEASLSEESAASLNRQPVAGLSMLSDWVEHLLQQGRPVEGERPGIGPFEQLQFSISPQATNRAFFERLANSVVMQQNGEGMNGETAQLFDLRQGMLASATTALDGALNGQPESAGINGNAALNSLLQLLGISGAATGITTDAESSHGPITAAGREGAHLDPALIDKLLTPSQSAQTGISENAKTAIAAHLSTPAAGDSNSEAILEAKTRQMSENSQSLKIQAANPNSANENITVKTPEEAFGIKSALQRGGMLPVHEFGGKISQIDSDSRDNGFLFSQDQLPQHPAKLENGAQPSEAAARSLMPQTLDQIVQKAALSLHNGQHEVQLHLKPDFLGHIRMQIISEGQQVAIKMVAELPFVKDMLENNLQQLKADLQAQGLDIDELEVSLAHDSHAERDVHQNAEAAKLRAGKTGTDSDDGSSEAPGQTQSHIGGSMADTAIDYFA